MESAYFFDIWTAEESARIARLQEDGAKGGT